MVRYPHIFTPLKVKSLYMKNRIGIPPVATNFAALDGSIRDEHIQYYIRRALGGPGLIIIENVNVDYPLGTNGTTQLRLDDDQYIPGLYTLVEKLQALGTAVSVQINHAGSGAYAGRLNGAEMVSASDIPAKQGMKAPRPLEIHEIEAIAEKFGRAAARVKQAGFDSVEIHAGHAYLLGQFLSPYYNRRQDEFGGSPENRARFPRMVAQAVRKAVGANFAVSMRISADEKFAQGNSLADTLKTMEFFADEIDIFNVSAGIMESIWYTMDNTDLPDGWKSDLSQAIRQRFGKPVMVAGNIRNPETAERILAEGKADVILIGRGHIADPDWVRKAAAGLEKEIRPCISCNIGCCGNRMGGSRPIRCTVNPDVVKAEPVPVSKVPVKVLVLGGGTAGMEAAATAAEMGCEVLLLEREKTVGGLAGHLATMKHKHRIGHFVNWQKNRANQLGNLQIVTEANFKIADLEEIQPDLIVVATGARPSLPPIPGLEEAIAKKRIFTALDILADPSLVANLAGKKIAIAGGGAVGLDIAEWCIDGDATDITIMEKLAQPGIGLDLITRSQFMSMLQNYKINVLTGCNISAIDENCFIAELNGEKVKIPFERGFVALGMTPDKKLAEKVERWCLQNERAFMIIGDVKSGRRILEGIREGHNIRYLITQLAERQHSQIQSQSA